MSDVLKGWGLKSRRRQSDGKAEVVGTNLVGREYVARTCDGPEVTQEDLKILDIGNPNKRDADAFVGFYRDQRDNARKNWEHSLDQEYTEAAEKVVHAGLHLRESRVGYSRSYASGWEKVFGETN